jgi:hypothetical protein
MTNANIENARGRMRRTLLAIDSDELALAIARRASRAGNTGCYSEG